MYVIVLVVNGAEADKQVILREVQRHFRLASLLGGCGASRGPKDHINTRI